MSQLPDVEYDIRAVTTCDLSTNASYTTTGIFDRVPPVNFGSPQPADGILRPGNEIMITFNEPIFEGVLNYSNFDISGVLNGTDLPHESSIAFNGSTDKYMIISEPINLMLKSFTVEMWVKKESTGKQCLLSQGSVNDDGLWIGFDETGKFTFSLAGTEVSTIEDFTLTDEILSWHHYAVTYNYESGVVQLFFDGKMKANETTQVGYEGFGRTYVGKSTFTEENPFTGNIHELRIWTTVQSGAKLSELSTKLLSGKEIGLTGNWRMDEGIGTMVKDYSANRHARVTSPSLWDVKPLGEALQVNGNGDYFKIEAGDIAFTYEQNFTIEFWYKADSGSNVCLLSNGKGDGLDFTETGWCINTDADENIWVSNNGIMFKAADAGTFDGNWHHFALIMNRIGNMISVVDGKQQYSTPGIEWGEFGGSHIYAGARVSVGESETETTTDQYFTGQLDEIRFWKLRKDINQVNMDINSRLTGNEVGLLAYFPFETYEDNAGVPLLTPSFKDGIMVHDTLKRAVERVGNTDYAGESPNIKLTRPVKHILPTWTSNTDKIVLTTGNKPASYIENCLLTFTVDSIRDLHGNYMQSPVTWSAYVKMNQVTWEENLFRYEKKLYDALSFEAKITNEGGTQEEFEITNLPAWLEASPSSGSIDALSEIIVKFTVSKGINTGYYTQDIYLSTGFEFDEKLILDLRVYDTEPEWEVNPADFQFSMSVVAQLKIDNIFSTDVYDKVAAFSNGECRGVANLQYVDEYDMYEVFMDIYSNATETEEIYFYAWDADKATLHTEATPKISFKVNDLQGTPSKPITISAEDIVAEKIELSKGWNWISFNVKSENLSDLNELFKDLDLKDGDMIKSATQYAQYNAGLSQWLGGVTTQGIGNEFMYKMFVNKDDTLHYQGPIIEPKNTPISIYPGWNWIGFVPRVNISVREVLASLELETDDILKSQTAFAVYDEYMGWIGSLEYMQPGKGYMFQAKNAGTLVYKKAGTLKEGSGNTEKPELKMNIQPGNFQSNMTILAKTETPLTKDDIIYGVNGIGECVGYGYPVYNSQKQEFYYFIVLSGNNTDDIKFTSINSENNAKVQFSEQVNFATDAKIGTLSKPYKLTVKTGNEYDYNNAVEAGFKCFPNPFTEKTELYFTEVGFIGKQVKITNAIGETIRIYNVTANTIEWDGKNNSGNIVSPGIYILNCNGKNIKVVKN